MPTKNNILTASGDRHYTTAGHAFQVRRREAEDRIRRTGGSPHLWVLQQVNIDQSAQRFCVPHRWHAANGKTGMLAHETRVGLIQRLPNHSSDFLQDYPGCPADQDQYRAPAVLPLEDQRLDDLPHVTPHRLGSF